MWSLNTLYISCSQFLHPSSGSLLGKASPVCHKPGTGWISTECRGCGAASSPAVVQKIYLSVLILCKKAFPVPAPSLCTAVGCTGCGGASSTAWPCRGCGLAIAGLWWQIFHFPFARPRREPTLIREGNSSQTGPLPLWARGFARRIKAPWLSPPFSPSPDEECCYT